MDGWKRRGLCRPMGGCGVRLLGPSFLMGMARVKWRSAVHRPSQRTASSIAARCVWLCSAVRLSHVPPAIIAVPASMRKSTAQACSPTTASASIPTPFLPSFQFPSSRVSVLCSHPFCLLCPFSTAASLSSSIPFFPSAQVSFPLISTTFVRMKCLLPLVMHAGVWGHAMCTPDSVRVWRRGSRYGGID